MMNVMMLMMAIQNIEGVRGANDGKRIRMVMASAVKWLIRGRGWECCYCFY
jgi:hypothetical protein